MSSLKITEKEKRVIRVAQGDMEITERPFVRWAEEAGLSEEEFLKILTSLKERGAVRRFGATLYHREAGIAANGMVAWDAPEGEVTRVGETMASFPEVSHCYERERFEGFPYNIYSMIHAPTEDEVAAVVARLSEATGIETYRILFSTEEFKKTSMRYFEEED